MAKHDHTYKPNAAKPGRVAEPAAAGALLGPRIVQIPAGEFKNTCLALMEDVRAGLKQFLITKHGEPVALLVAPDAKPARAFGFMRGTVASSDDIVEPDFDAWAEAE